MRGTLGDQFNQFLHISDQELDLLQRFSDQLSHHAGDFGQHFYRYLFSYPATTDILNRYRDQGGDLQQLEHHQTRHLLELLKGVIDESSASQLDHIGQQHYAQGIKPVWIMGAYRLYLDFLQNSVAQLEIEDEQRGQLRNLITKLVFRDMGLMNEGYWHAATDAIRNEQEKVRMLQEQVASLLKNLPQILWSVDVKKNQLLYISPSAQDICLQEATLPIPCLGWTIAEDQEMVLHGWQKALAGFPVTLETRVQNPGGELRWFRRMFQPFVNADGEVERIDGFMEDTSASKAATERLHYLATTDTLTQLANRSVWNDRLQQAINQAQRDARQEVAVMLLDLNHFKNINDTLGHPVGDIILRQVAERLSITLRKTDNLARLGGDEFGLMLVHRQQDKEVAVRVVRKILACFQQPFIHHEHRLHVGASIGIAVYPQHGEDVDTLVSRADMAMYYAKRNNLGYHTYNPSVDRKAQSQMELSMALRGALENNEFELHFQPKLNITNGALTGVEALIRWNHKKRGAILPDRFIPMAEQNGLIIPITEWVVQAALAQVRQWQQQGLEIPVAVNVSSICLQDGDFVAMIEKHLKLHNLSAKLLEIEVTENVLMSQGERAISTIHAVNALGVRVAIDDFGTGYCSLAYLNRLPANVLKIDRSFIQDIYRADTRPVIVQSIIELGHNLGYTVIAEGVELGEAHEALAAMGCDQIQGYYISHPLPADDFGQWLKQRH